MDITKILLHIETKMQNSWGKAEMLQSAFKDFQTSWQNFDVSPQVQAWFHECQTKMAEPDLTSVMNYEAPLPMVNVKTTVSDCARVMKDLRQTAVLVMDQQKNELAGIFTTKDICLRVLAPNDLEARSTSVIRVMTPHPDCGTEDMTIRQAMKKMHDGHYLHLPVRNAVSGRVAGLVDVLTLTYHTMEQLMQQQEMKPSSVAGSATDAAADLDASLPGPMWSRFFESTTQDQGDINEALAKANSVQSQSQPSVTGSQSCTTVVPGLVNGTGFVFKFRDPLTTTIHRFSCRVVAGENGESPLAELLETVIQKCGCHVLLDAQAATETPSQPALFNGGSQPLDGVPLEKRTALLLQQYQQQRHIKAEPNVMPLVVTSADQTDSVAPHVSTRYFFRLSYKDDEGDLVFLHSDSDLMDAVGVARMMGWGRLVLRVEIAIEDPISGEPLPIRSDCHLDDAALMADDEPLIPELKQGTSMTMMLGVAGALLGVAVAGMFIAKRMQQ